MVSFANVGARVVWLANETTCLLRMSRDHGFIHSNAVTSRILTNDVGDIATDGLNLKEEIKHIIGI